MKTAARKTATVKETKIRLGQNIAAARKAKGWTQPELAHLTGLNIVTLSRTETGITTPSFSRLVEIAEALDTTVAVLVGGTSQSVFDVGDEIQACLTRLREPDRQFVLGMVRQWTDRLAKK